LGVEGGRTYLGRSAAGHRTGLREKRFFRTASQKSAEGKVGPAVGKAMEALHQPKGGATDRPSRERGTKARTVPARGIKEKASKPRDSGADSGRKTSPNKGNWPFPGESRSEAPKATGKGTETRVAKRQTESLAGTERRREEVCERENGKPARQRVQANKGSPGIDGRTVEELPEYLQPHGLTIGEHRRNGTYPPQPGRRVEIEKPEGRGMHQLGIPTVRDRCVQQAGLQVLQKRWDPTFCEHNHGFRPGRSAKPAV